MGIFKPVAALTSSREIGEATNDKYEANAPSVSGKIETVTCSAAPPGKLKKLGLTRNQLAKLSGVTVNNAGSFEVLVTHKTDSDIRPTWPLSSTSCGRTPTPTAWAELPIIKKQKKITAHTPLPRG